MDNMEYKKFMIETGDLGDRMALGLPYSNGGGIGMTGVDTYSSPDVQQTPSAFKYPRKAGSVSDISIPSPEDYDNSPKLDPDEFSADVKSIKHVVTPDEVIAGVNYELKSMPIKRKDTAKQIVAANLKKDPRYYSKLHMLNIDDDNVISAKEQSESLDIYRTPQENEIAKIVRMMLEDKLNKRSYYKS
jgi:hypothetical protein